VTGSSTEDRVTELEKQIQELQRMVEQQQERIEALEQWPGDVAVVEVRLFKL
jgi:predicted RNase H-like nuclease (RuvC/YqgF family)